MDVGGNLEEIALVLDRKIKGKNYVEAFDFIDKVSEADPIFYVLSALTAEKLLEKKYDDEKVFAYLHEQLKEEPYFLKKEKNRKNANKHLKPSSMLRQELTVSKLLEHKAHLDWWKVIRHMLKNPNLTSFFESIGGYSVFRANLHALIKGTLVFKQGEFHSLKIESENLEELKSKSYGEFGVVEPKRIVRVDNDYYLIERLAIGRSLTEAFEATRDFELFIRTAHCLRKIHDRMDKSSRKTDSHKYYLLKKIKKALNAGLPPGIAVDILENLSPLYTVLLPNHVFDKDAHSDNFFVGEGKIIVLDAEDKGYTSRAFDLAKLIYRNDYFDSKQARAIVEAYCTAPNHELLKTSSMLEDTKLSVPYKAALYWLFALEDPSKMRRAHQFLANTKTIYETSKLALSEKKKICSLADRLIAYRASA